MSQFKIERELNALDKFEEYVAEVLSITSRSHALFKQRKLYENSESQEVADTLTDLMTNLYDEG